MTEDVRPEVSVTVVHSQSTCYNDLIVEDIGQLRTLRFGDYVQSSMYLDSPFDTAIEYPQYFHLSLALKPDATRTLAIGLGGATTPKRMWRDYPNMQVVAVEIDPVVVDVARRYFELPDDPRLRILVDDGRHYVETTDDPAFDIIIVDAFDAGQVPHSLSTWEFMRITRERLTPEGVLVYNVMGAVEGPASVPFRRLHRTIAGAFDHVWIFEVEEGVDSAEGNIVVLATNADVPTYRLRSRIYNRVGGLVSVPAFHTFRADMYTGPVEYDGAPVLTDTSTG
jgi:spermidine synthase